MASEAGGGYAICTAEQLFDAAVFVKDTMLLGTGRGTVWIIKHRLIKLENHCPIPLLCLVLFLLFAAAPLYASVLCHT